MSFWITKASWVVPGLNAETCAGDPWQFKIAEQAADRIVRNFPHTLRRLAEFEKEEER